MTTAAEFIAGFELFSEGSYWDVNAWRLGYGSDTEGPDEIPVTKGMHTTKERALQNLALRIPKFAHEAIYGHNGMGADTWINLTENQRSAVLSFVYNYGSLRFAIDPTDPEKTAKAIRARGADNGGVNRRRREKEAAFYLLDAKVAQRAPPVPQAPAPHVPSTIPAPAQTIPASSAGQVAAALDQLIAYQADYRSKIPTPFDEAIASLEKLGAAPPLSLPLQKSADVKAAPQLKGMKTMESQILAIVRNALIFGGGYFVSKGWVDNSTMIAIVGGAISMGGAIWSALGHTKTSVIAAAAALPEIQKIVTTPAIAESPQFAANPTVVSR